jgi:2,3-bisphosphoglycerate-independent phosphoglycerate mutase
LHVLLIFIDGIGLGDDDPAVNPFASANTPTLHQLSGGARWLRGVGRRETDRAIFIPADARMGVPGRPQSGTNQATILTGKNIAQIVGEHYGPKPNATTRALLDDENLFKQVKRAGKRGAIINAYPPRLLRDIARGKTLPSSIQYAQLAAQIPLYEAETLYSGVALSEDWTGQGWRDYLGYTDTPLYTPQEAGRRMVEVSRRYDFAFFSHWYTDTVGHRGTLDEAQGLLTLIDGVMAGALETWDDEGLMILTSDHGNMEAIGDRHHTENDVPLIVIGSQKYAFAEELTDLAGIAPRIARVLGVG